MKKVIDGDVTAIDGLPTSGQKICVEIFEGDEDEMLLDNFEDDDEVTQPSVDSFHDDDEDPGDPVPDDDEAAPDPDPSLPNVDGLQTMIEAAVAKTLRDAEPYEGKVDVRDVFPVVSNNKLRSARLRDVPGIGAQAPVPQQSAPVTSGPAVILGRTGEIDVSAKPFNARGDNKTDCSKALLDAIGHVTNGGVINIPAGQFRCRLRAPATKSFILRGSSPWASNLVGFPGEDIINVDRGNNNVQRRTGRRNRHMYEKLGFWLTGCNKDHRGKYNRKSASGWRAAHACIAYEEGEKGRGKHDAWCNSYGMVQHCLFSQAQKGNTGGTAIYFGSVHYGWTFEDIEIGEHGGSIAGTAGGIIDGVPSWGIQNTEHSSDSNYYHRIRHWNPSLSLSILNQGNSSIGNVEIYHQTYRALEVLGMKSHNRSMPRDLSIFGSFYNDNELDNPSDAKDNAHIVIDCQSTAAKSSVIHLKGVRKKSGGGSPVIKLGGYGFDGHLKLQSSQGHHNSPVILADGSHHRVSVDCAGFSPAAMKALVRDKGRGNEFDIKKVT